ncbi:USP6 N-terminal-like protein [Thelohanellus kitauei]|uniref:USP6 N-terminal-like protein n=1 Tax=Thelohanellus kitauei TaxID=669202 RepID=A0A0C2MSM4_THEKT|nr:USP6 N-terminal-like protein [Thelohanellus kitauei]
MFVQSHESSTLTLESEELIKTGQDLFYNFPNDSRVDSEARVQTIYQSYDKGPTAADIESSQYSSTNINCYGFILEANARHSDEKIQDESVRITRWTKILNNWEKFLKKDKKFVYRCVLRGIPNCLRGQAWKKLLSVDKKMDENVGVYQRLVRMARSTSKDAIQIDKDVERTNRSHVLFNVRYSIKQRELFYLLLAYSVYDVKVRYCQGMNELASVLLMFLSEEETFWALTILTCDEIHNIHGFFSEGFPKVRLFEDHLIKILETHMPQLMEHFNRIGYEIRIITTRWFILFYINCIPFSMLLRIFDRFMLEGCIILYPIAYTILKYHKKTLMRLSIDEVSEFFKTMDRYPFDVPLFFKKLDKNISFLTSLKLYPIPGVAHSVIDIDVQSILAEDPQSKVDSIETFDTSFKGSLQRGAFLSNDGKMTEQTQQASMLSDALPLFDPVAITPPYPQQSWAEFTYAHRDEILDEVESYEVSDKFIEFEKLSQIISDIYKSSQIN